MNEQKRKPVGILLTVILIAALLTICLELGLSYLRPDTPGSIPKHLIHFGIMFALLGGAVLLCLFCPPFKKLWAWIDQHILDKETRPIAIDIIYAVIAGLMLLHHFYILLYYPTIPAGATKFTPIWIILAAFTVLLNKSWREFLFHLVVFFLVYTFERLYIKNLAITGNDIVYFSSAFYALFICLGLFSTLRSSIRMHFLRALCFLWTFGVLVLSIAGMITAWTGLPLTNIVGSTIHERLGRLEIFSPATITAGNLGCGIIMSLIGIFISKRKLTKSFYSLACISILIANSLVDSRSCILALSSMSAGVLCLGLWTLFQKRAMTKPSKKKNIVTIVALVFCFFLCFFGLVECQRYLASCFIDIRDSGTLPIPIATAEEITKEVNESPQPPDFIQRGVWLSSDENINLTLNGRYIIWQKSIAYIKENKHILLYGLSVDGSAASAIGREEHHHNLLLQILFEGGVPALFLFLVIILYHIYHAFRLWNRNGIPFWQRILPLPVFAILLWEMAECLTHFSYGHPPMTLFWFFLGATITVSKSLGKAPKTTEQPAIPAESAVTETGE